MNESPSRQTKYVSLISKERQSQIKHHEQTRNVSIASQVSAISVVSVSEFLSERVQQLVSEREMLRAYKNGLLEAKKSNTITEEESQAELEAVVGEIRPISKSLTTLQRQKRTIEEDMEDDIVITKRERQTSPDVTFFEKAYTNSIVTRVMNSSGNMAKSSFTKKDKAKFREAVLKRYDAVKSPPGYKIAWCHLTGWWDPEKVTAAHLVPKALTGDELSFLFGVGELPSQDPRNGISLHTKIENALDNGLIVIVPLLNDGQEEEKWICVLVDKSIGEQTVTARPGNMSSVGRSGQHQDSTEIILWKDLDGEELEFLAPNRPAKRYLYFRFIITYIYAKSKGNTEFTSTVESRSELWAIPGEYLERSTLKALARNISGLELPESLIKDHTFENESVSDSERNDVGEALADDLRRAAITSIQEMDQGEGEGSDEELENE